ncbi:unnamed protein product, partial [Prorocentrum cordatum]
MYVCEIAPPARRGQFVIMNEAAVCVGCLLGLEVGAAVVRGGSAAAGAWRLAVALGAVPAAVQLFFIFTLPEKPEVASPARRHRGARGRLPQAGPLGQGGARPHEERVKGRRGPGDQSCQELEGFPPMEGLLRWLRRLCRVQRAAWKAHSSSFLVALCFFFFTAASGISGMQSYAFDILLVSGVAEPLRLLPLVGWVKLAGSLIAAASADSPRVGRRVLAVVGSCSCMLCDAALAVHLAMPGLLPPAVPATALFVFIFGWNVGFGSLQFVVSLEVLPNEVRSTWSGQIYALVGLVEIALLQLFETMPAVSRPSCRDGCPGTTKTGFPGDPFLTLFFAVRRGPSLSLSLSPPGSRSWLLLAPASSRWSLSLVGRSAANSRTKQRFGARPPPLPPPPRRPP